MKIGLIGAGAWGQNHLRVWRRLGLLAVVCEADDTRRSRFQEEHPDVRFTPFLRDLTGDPANIGQNVVVSPEIVSLPIFPEMQDTEIDAVTGAIRGFFG